MKVTSQRFSSKGVSPFPRGQRRLPRGQIIPSDTSESSLHLLLKWPSLLFFWQTSTGNCISWSFYRILWEWRHGRKWSFRVQLCLVSGEPMNPISCRKRGPIRRNYLCVVVVMPQIYWNIIGILTMYIFC